MRLMEFLIVLLLCATSTTVYFIIISSASGSRRIISARLGDIMKMHGTNERDEFSEPFFLRAVRPVLEDINKVIVKITPKEILAGFDKKSMMAGYPFGLQGKDWLNIQAVLVILLPLITITLGSLNSMEPRKWIFLSIAEIALGMLFPLLILNSKIRARQREIQNSLPDIIDLLTVSVEAGLGFDSALAKVIEKFPGQLAVEFSRVLQEIKMGKPKKDALKSMSDRVGVTDLTTFVGSIIQAEQYGVAIGHVLRIQSEQMRIKRKQRAQEKAMKAPVKMLIPMVLFIFPTIFSVLIGPVAIKMVNVFFK